MTRSRFGKSMPRAATSVATQTRARPSRNACSAIGSLVLGQFARQRDHGEAALQQRRLQMPDGFRVLQNTSALGNSKSQSVDDRVLDIAGAIRMARYSMSAWPPSSPATSTRKADFVESQNIDDGVLDIAGRDPDRAVLDVGMAALVAATSTRKALLIFFRQRDDAARQCRRKQQRAAFLRRRPQG